MAKEGSSTLKWMMPLLLAVVLLTVAVIILAIFLVLERDSVRSRTDVKFIERASKPDHVCQRTPYDIIGPFYVPNATLKTSYCGASSSKQKLIVHGHVMEEFCKKSIGGAMVEVWQANDNGTYTEECRGHVVADNTGYFRFETTHPGNYFLETFFRASHIHYRVSRPDDSDSFYTQQYFADDEHSAGQVEDLVTQIRPLDSNDPDGHQIVEFNFIMHKM